MGIPNFYPVSFQCWSCQVIFKTLQPRKFQHQENGRNTPPFCPKLGQKILETLTCEMAALLTPDFMYVARFVSCFSLSWWNESAIWDHLAGICKCGALLGCSRYPPTVWLSTKGLVLTLYSLCHAANLIWKLRGEYLEHVLVKLLAVRGLNTAKFGCKVNCGNLDFQGHFGTWNVIGSKFPGETNHVIKFCKHWLRLKSNKCVSRCPFETRTLNFLSWIVSGIDWFDHWNSID